MVLLPGLWCSGVQAFGPSRRFRSKLAAAWALSGATWHELQSELLMAATYVGKRPSYKPRPPVASARPGAT